MRNACWFVLVAVGCSSGPPTLAALPNRAFVRRDMRPRVALVLFVLLFAAACRRHEILRIGAIERKVVLSVPLARENSIASPFAPVVHVEVGARRARLLVDTGSTRSAITKWLADDLGMSTERHAEDTGRDFVGSPLDVERSSPLDIRADSGPVVARGVVLVVDTPMLPRHRGVGGVLSPQLMLRPGYSLVLDLIDGRMAVVAGALGRTDPWADKGMVPSGMRLCGLPGAYLVPAIVDGTDVLLRLDTGADQTSIFMNSSLGQSLLSKIAVASGAAQSSNVQFGQVASKLRAGGVATNLDLRLIPGQSPVDCKYDGLLGMDVLKRCMITLDQQTGFATCD